MSRVPIKNLRRVIEGWLDRLLLGRVVIVGKSCVAQRRADEITRVKIDSDLVASVRAASVEVNNCCLSDSRAQQLLRDAVRRRLLDCSFDELVV
jgi:hypothetical protein